MKLRWCFFIFCLLGAVQNIHAQGIRLDYEQQSLNDILLDLNQRLKVQVSIDSELANRCIFSIHEQFDGIDQAMQALAKACQLAFVKIDGVYTFYPAPEELEPDLPDKPRERPQYLYQGVVVESATDEPVPYAMMQFGNRGIVADENGHFSFKSFRNPEKGLFRSLGYELSDTTITPGARHKISLNPALIELEAIEVFSDTLKLATHMGDEAGHIRFNDISNNLVPGLSNNLIFNNLRLYPGIMAAGEAITDFVIWGSYAGQNHVTFDDITLFNSWGINDDMGRINPYMIRNVEVYKGAFNVPYGDRIGGVVRMEGSTGNQQEMEWQASLTNQLGNAYFNTPLGKATTLQLAARKTIFQDFGLSAGFNRDDDLIVPVYDYTDINLKLVSQVTEQDRIEISGIYSEDSYTGDLTNVGRRNIVQNLRLNSTQSGASFRYSHNWDSGGISGLTAAYSRYDPTVTANYLFNIDQRPIGDTLLSYAWTNPIEELKVEATHAFSATNRHQAKLSLAYIQNQGSLESSADRRILENDSLNVQRFSAYALNDFQLSPEFSVQLGLKADLPQDGELYFQPRINARYDFTPKWNVHLGWGKYNQFISKNFVVDELGNRSEVWQEADGSRNPVIESTHNVLGIAYASKAFEAGVEGFHKEAEGFLRYTFNRNGNAVFRALKAQTKGMELYARKRIDKHQFSLAYTLMEVEESLADVPANFSVSRLAPQSQEHELKLIANLNFHPLQVSLTNVYGSGFPNRTVIREQASFDIYRRTDLAVQYSFKFDKLQGDAGLSILNLFNQQNVRLNQAVNVPSGSIINTVGIPFTPTVYLNLKF